MQPNKPLYLFIPIILLINCAKQTSPTGGPKDTIPPAIIKSSPPNGQTNFSSSTIELEFSELITLDNPKEQLIITPDVNKDYDIKAKKKKVILNLNRPLTENTTYSFNFRDAVKDITEKNPARNLKLAISTGSFIDSLSISGKINDPLTNKEFKDATVALFSSDTFNIFKHKPQLISKTDNAGHYIIENLKHGKYYIYAFDDKNKNLIVDSKTERYGFTSTSIQLDENIEQPQLPIVKLDARPIKLTSARPYNTYFNLKFSKGIKTYRATLIDSQDSLASILAENNTIIKIYKPNLTDSIPFRLTATDSIRQKLDTVLYLKLSGKKATPEKFTSKLIACRLIQRTGLLEGTIEFSKPVTTHMHDSVTYSIDSVTVIRFERNDFLWHPKTNTVSINKLIDKKILSNADAGSTQNDPIKTKRKNVSKFELKIPKGTFISIDGDSSEAKSETVKPITTEETGVIKVTVNTMHPNFIVQLLSKENKVISEAFNKKSASFEDLKPGEYQLRIIGDWNADKEWSPGNFYAKEEPEPIIYYYNEKKSTSIILKANWELGPLLITF